jgi:hypothetical protein
LLLPNIKLVLLFFWNSDLQLALIDLLDLYLWLYIKRGPYAELKLIDCKLIVEGHNTAVTAAGESG